MNAASHLACLVAVGCMTLVIAGCSSKSLQSRGDTSRAPSAPYPGNFPSTGTERVDSGLVLAKADPARAQRQLEEMRAEQAATAAAGLRDVFFAYDSWMITEEGRQVLTRDAEWLRAHGLAQMKVEGHCDERGSSAYNLVLGEKRAKAVRNYLMELGVKGNRLTIVSYGKERPFCHDRSESCYQQNRRGHLLIGP
jgi:peptidoglycan-associated lipoprotein